MATNRSPPPDAASPVLIALASLLVLALAYGWWLTTRRTPAPAEGYDSALDQVVVSPRRVVGYLGEVQGGHVAYAYESDQKNGPAARSVR